MAFDVFRKFFTREESEELGELLRSKDIPYKLEDMSEVSDIPFLGELPKPKFIVKTRVQDFPRIEALLDSQVSLTLDQVDREHYLFGFTDAELTDIITKPDEWNSFDYKVAELLLQERGIPVSATLIDNIKEQRYNALGDKEKYSPTLVTIGYVFAVLGGVIGLAIGGSLWLMTKDLPNGEKTYVYSEDARRHGRRITLISIVMFSFYVLLRFMPEF